MSNIYENNQIKYMHRRQNIIHFYTTNFLIKINLKILFEHNTYSKQVILIFLSDLELYDNLIIQYEKHSSPFV